MNVVFFGTPEWAVPTLRALAASSHRVVAVVTAPDAAAGRSRTPAPPPVKAAALELDLGPVLQPLTLKGDENRAPILAAGAEAFVVVAYGRILPGRLLDAPRHGAVNVHFSRLPRHRGASPVQHAILLGDAVTGVSTMRMDRGLDTGPVLLVHETPVGARETSSRLGARLADAGAALLLRTLDGLAAGGLAPRRQPAEGATHARILRKEDGRVAWSLAAPEIDRRVRAFDPWPPCTCRGPKGALQLLEVEPLAPDVRAGDAPPGTVLRRAGEAVDVAAGEGTVLRVARVKPENGKAMTAAAALAGRHLAVGLRLQDGAP